MKMTNLFAGAALAAALATATTGAYATTYTGVRTFDGTTVDLSLTTDGVTGVVNQGDILSWNIAITDVAGSADLTPADSQFGILGNAGDMTATPTALTFNFSGGNGIWLWEQTTIGDGGPYYCIDGTGACDFTSEEASTQWGEADQVGQFVEGSQVIATAGVPEPATWAMMLVGFGGLGMAMRSRRRQAVATA